MPRKISKFISILLCLCLVGQQSGFAQIMPSPQAAVLSQPPLLRYLSVNSANPFNYFNFLLDKGLSPSEASGTVPDLSKEAKKLIDYFFLGITLSSESFWVNLRPDEPGRITSDDLAKTDLGRTLLEQDLQLKRDVAKLIHPNHPKGKEFWEALYAAIGKDKVKKAEITTSNRVWIVPDEAIVVETEDGAFVASAKLKVLLENDYLKGLSLSETRGLSPQGTDPKVFTQAISEKFMREIILPPLTEEINNGPTYAPLRQIYQSLILAEWFKRKSAQKGLSPKGTVDNPYNYCINKGFTKGLESELPWSKQAIWQEYLKSYRNGEYKLEDTLFGLKRMYWSGGMKLGMDPQVNPEFNFIVKKANELNAVIQLEDLKLREKSANLVPVLSLNNVTVGNEFNISTQVVGLSEEASSPLGLSAKGPSESGASSNKQELSPQGTVPESSGSPMQARSASSAIEWNNFKNQLGLVITDKALFGGLLEKAEKSYLTYQNSFVDEALMKGRLFIKALYESLYSPGAAEGEISYIITHHDYKPGKYRQLEQELGREFLESFRKDYFPMTRYGNNLNNLSYEEILKAARDLIETRNKYNEFFEKNKAAQSAGSRLSESEGIPPTAGPAEGQSASSAMEGNPEKDLQLSLSDKTLQARRKIVGDEELENVMAALKRIRPEDQQKTKELLHTFLKEDVSPASVDRFIINNGIDVGYNGLWCLVRFEYGKKVQGGSNINPPKYIDFLIKFDSNKIVDILLSNEDPESARFGIEGKENIFVRLKDNLFDSKEEQSLLRDAVERIKGFDARYSFTTAQPGHVTIDLDKNLFLKINTDKKHSLRDNSYFMNKIEEMLKSPIAPIFAYMLSQPRIQGLCFSKDIVMLDVGTHIGGEYVRKNKLILDFESAFDHEFSHHIYYELILPDRKIFEELLSFARTNDAEGLEVIMKHPHYSLGVNDMGYILNEWFAFRFSKLLDSFLATKDSGIWLSPLQCKLIEKLIELKILPHWLNPDVVGYEPGIKEYGFRNIKGQSYDKLVVEYLSAGSPLDEAKVVQSASSAMVTDIMRIGGQRFTDQGKTYRIRATLKDSETNNLLIEAIPVNHSVNKTPPNLELYFLGLDKKNRNLIFLQSINTESVGLGESAIGKELLGLLNKAVPEKTVLVFENTDLPLRENLVKTSGFTQPIAIKELPEDNPLINIKKPNLVAFMKPESAGSPIAPTVSSAISREAGLFANEIIAMRNRGEFNSENITEKIIRLIAGAILRLSGEEKVGKSEADLFEEIILDSETSLRGHITDYKALDYSVEPFKKLIDYKDYVLGRIAEDGWEEKDKEIISHVFQRMDRLVKGASSALSEKTEKGGIDLSKIELTLKDESYISSLNPADIKVLRAAKALGDQWDSLSLLYVHEIMILMKDGIIKDIQNKELLQNVLQQLQIKSFLDPQAIQFFNLIQSEKPISEIKLTLAK